MWTLTDIVKLRILKQNIFGDNCCTVFVSYIFVYCYFGDNNMHFLFLFLLILCLFILRKCCMWLTWTVNKISKFWKDLSVFFFAYILKMFYQKCQLDKNPKLTRKCNFWRNYVGELIDIYKYASCLKAADQWQICAF